MNNIFKNLTSLLLLGALILCVQSCNDQNIPLEKSKVQFTLTSGTASDGRVPDIDPPEDARLRVTIETSSGTPILEEHEINVLKAGNSYVADPLALKPGTYVITDFMMVNDVEVLNAVPKIKSPLSAFVMHSLPYSFSVTQDGVANVGMQVMDARSEKPEAFGYTSFRGRKADKLSFMVTGHNGRLRNATAELRQGKNQIKTFPVRPGVNTIALEGDPDAQYTLSVYAGELAQSETFNFRELKKELGPRPMKITLEPALLLTIESSVDEANEYGEYFELVLDGAAGAVNVNWGDGRESSHTLPLTGEHEYTFGTYTAIVTGDLDRITNLYGFSYGTVIYGITGLTNLTALKTYNPSWGAVPIKVDLSNCKMLETIYVEKHGGPYEPIDLLTEFKLPEEHFIKEFVFYVPSLDPTRENIAAEELAMLADNIYNNTVRRNIYGGKFFVYPVVTPSPETQRKLDILKNQYNWDVRLDGNIWDDYFEGGRRTKSDLNASRERWLREKFPDNKRIMSRSDRMVVQN